MVFPAIEGFASSLTGQFFPVFTGRVVLGKQSAISVGSALAARAALLVLAANIGACGASLATLPSAAHERAQFNAPEEVAWWINQPTRSLIQHGGSTSSKSSDNHIGRAAGTDTGRRVIPISVARNDDNAQVDVDEWRLNNGAEHSDPLQTRQENVSINAVGTPVESLLFALADNADLELVINGNLSQLVTVKVLDQPLRALLNNLAEQASFSWTIENNLLRVWSGTAYIHSYAIDYLNIDRQTQSRVGLATQVGTINAADATASVANSSETHVENVSEHHLWHSLRTDVEGLITQRQVNPADQADASLAQFSINREAGLLTLFATPAVHQAVQVYLEKLHDTIQRQVLIEATVVEVALSDSFEAGVDWQVLAQGIDGFSAAQVLLGAPAVNSETVERLSAPTGLFSLVQQGSAGDVRATLSLLEQFGDVRILSRPRIIALNNQSSVLKVVDNRVYFTVNVERRQTDTKDEVVTETEIHTVPVGLVMNVTPQISRDGAVMLNVRPTLSRILGFVNDPNPELAQANVRNSVPEIQVREMESMLQVKSGNVAIIGGLMQDTSEDNEARLPGLGRLPLIKHLFSQRAHKRRQTELLIVLRPTVVSISAVAFH